jgi:hypothetical protein
MFNILDAITAGLSALNTPIGFGGSLITVFDHFKNKNSSLQFLNLSNPRLNMAF